MLYCFVTIYDCALHSIIFTLYIYSPQHQELNSTKEELEDLQMMQQQQQSTEQEPPGPKSASTTTINHDWERKQQKFLEKEEEYQNHIRELQAELDDLQEVDLEREKLEKEKAGLVKKCRDIFEEHQTTLQGKCFIVVIHF